MQLELNALPEVHARVALIVYTDHRQEQGIVMQHALGERDGALYIAEGVNVTRDTIETLLKLNALQTLTLVPEHVVALGVGSLAWVVERQERRLLFQGATDKAVAALDGQVFPQPRLLFVTRGAQMFAYALRGTERPTGDTPLYRAPYFNIFSNHAVCNGSMQRPGAITPENADAWTQAFFYSNFVKPADSQKRWATGGTYRELWDAVREAGEFKDEWLVPAGLALAQALGGQ
ncbi:PRTRC system protein B [Deinococcus aestuarii]|uniref:PRTRC system protein B n=1 Tax=Deinococcus aestuarii TaxID=2774531 RepID=UPI001C0E4505|nr:PRTRC system protein B [Deinococcus aestuarii]